MTLQVSIHNNCRWAGPERFHIRIRLDDALMASFMEKVVNCAESDQHEFFNVGGYFHHNGKRFRLEDGEFGEGAVIDPKVSDIAYAGICVDDIQFSLTPYQGGWNVDFSLDKIYDTDEDLNHMKWLDTGEDHPLPECFWVKPVSIVRAIIQH